jgi:hypothetical protein
MKPIHCLLVGTLALAVTPVRTAGAGSDTSDKATAVPDLMAAPPIILDEDPPPRFSLPTESDRALWRKPGFRFGLGLVYGRFFGIDGPPNGNLIGPTVRMGLRLDEQWSLMGSLQYLYATASNVMRGLRFAGTVEPTWHATDHLSLSVGLGFGGLIENGSNKPDPSPLGGTLNSSYTFPNASAPLPSCSGGGVTGLLRGEWSWILGPRASTALALETDGQWTGCVDDTGQVDPDTATPIVRRQWWPHVGASLAWVITWR